MPSRKAVDVCILSSLLAFAFASSAAAQVTATAVPMSLSALKPESITVTLTSSNTVTFNLVGGSADTGSIIPAWTTNWNLKHSENTVMVCVFLSGALSGTNGNTDTVPMAYILGGPGGVAPFTAITGNGCGQIGNALVISTTALTNANRKNGSKSDSVALEINDAPLVLQADTYSGTLNIVAQATP